ncbi:nucleotide-diphosphate-sugar epimerase [Streptomyces spiroverticillatus]|uniref:Nucleotide-diphosphate-sugar epimerase n=1 Tax=Streptomyces finlayi TaxID=67296 RepID=A0A918WUG7_9ACTN|nr:NAD(P)H-binding protein [Streptomyces finlayi]GGZ97495.1 nucleotide-diphosphate-sugar epimerase [Streptomyces spiroverticillatus]GHC82612.1 nucleotide-diphosphate-sugar epimerase [Streptomyces finlayi]
MTKTQNDTQKVLVTGATGTVGRQVVAELLARGASVRALTRNPAKADFPAEVEVVRGDLGDPASLAPALEGVEAVHLIVFGGDAYAPLTTGPEVLAQAAKAGVRRVTVLHGGGASLLEDAVRGNELGIRWTVLMAVEFMANALFWADDIKEHGRIEEPFADRISSMVHEGDIGAVAAVALLDRDGVHHGKEHVITGPAVLTLADKVRILGEARGAEVGLVELTEEQAVERMRAQGVPQENIDFLLMAYGNTPEVGRTVASTVQDVTGRPARTFEEWAKEHAGAFRGRV